MEVGPLTFLLKVEQELLWELRGRRESTWIKRTANWRGKGGGRQKVFLHCSAWLDHNGRDSRTAWRRGQRNGQGSNPEDLLCYAEGMGLPCSDAAINGLEQGDIPMCTLEIVLCVHHDKQGGAETGRALPPSRWLGSLTRTIMGWMEREGKAQNPKHRGQWLSTLDAL